MQTVKESVIQLLTGLEQSFPKHWLDLSFFSHAVDIHSVFPFPIVGGPYHIVTADVYLVNKKSKERKRLYWKVCPIDEGTLTYRIECTFDKAMEACNFYLKPFGRYTGGEKYFYIVTDPEDPRGRLDSSGKEAKLKPNSEPEHDKPEHNLLPEHELQQECGSEVEWEPQVDLEREPQRYVQVNKQNGQLEAELVVKKNKHSAFKLKNPQDDMTCSLSRSQWLPEASLGSQPYIICREGKSFQLGRKVRSVYINEENGKYTVVHREDSPSTCPFSARLFILEPGHKT